MKDVFLIFFPRFFLWSSKPFSLFIGEAVFARCLSSLKSERVAASKILVGPKTKSEDYVKDKKEFIEHIRKVSCEM